MGHHCIEIGYERVSNGDLSPAQQYLVEKASQACNNSYSPYSEFAVGAAAELANGKILSANNQENVAYPSGMCAERTLLYYVKAQYPDIPILRVAIAAKNKNGITETPVLPCGACRQVMLETAKRQDTPIELIMAGRDRSIVIENVCELLPFSFDSILL